MEISEVPHILPTAGPADATTTDDDLAMQSAVLIHVLAVHPTKITFAELKRELAGEEADFGTTDAIDRAARDLSGIGLLHLTDGFVAPTRAALRDRELLAR